MVPVMTPTLVMYQLTPIFHCQECCPPAQWRSFSTFPIWCYMCIRACGNRGKLGQMYKMGQKCAGPKDAQHSIQLTTFGTRKATDKWFKDEFPFPCFLFQNVKDRPWACGSVVCQACVFCCIINVVTRDHACSCLPPVSNTNIANFYQQTDRNHWRLC